MGMESSAPIRIENVWLSFGSHDVLRGLSCEFPKGRVSTILGGSGSGKTTLLRAIGGLAQPRSGDVRVAGQSVAGLSDRALRPLRDRIGMLFQGGALLDSLTVFDNLALPLRERTRRSEAEIAREVASWLGAVGLPDAGSAMPRELSGGMLKRVALARAVVMRPEILLCDEPYSGLDPLSRRRIEGLLMRMNQRIGATVVIASHHVTAALRTSDWIVFLLEGKAISGTPQEIRKSSSAALTEFLEADQTERPPLDEASA